MIDRPTSEHRQIKAAQMARAESNTHPLGNIDRLVHEPARLQILSQIYVIEACDFLFMQKQTGLTKGNLSSHLAKLEDAGYVEIVKEFDGKRPRTLLRLTPSGRKAFSRHVASLRQWIRGVPNDMNP